MSRRRKAKVRILLSGFSSRIGSETLNVRIYRDREAFVCERELVERDGTSFTMVLPFREPADVRNVLEADPYYPRVRGDVARILGTLDRVVREHGKRAA
jgi:hypothetical protein